MSPSIWCHLAYLLISLALAIWVGRTLHKHGRYFLVGQFQGNEALADSINHLQVVGFYLITFGILTFALRFGSRPHDWQSAVEIVATKVGLVLVGLGVVHLYRLYHFLQSRKRSQPLT
jgi:hypothetical protein